MANEKLVGTGKFLINRMVIGILFVVLVGTAGAIASYVLQTQLTGSIQDLGTGIQNIYSVQGIGMILWWAFSTLIIAGVALFLVKHQKVLSPFKSENIKHDMPTKLTLVVILALGALISFLLWIVNVAFSVFGRNLSSTDVHTLYIAVMSGDLFGVFFGVVMAIVAGTVVVVVAGKSHTVEKIVDDAHINKI